MESLKYLYSCLIGSEPDLDPRAGEHSFPVGENRSGEHAHFCVYEAFFIYNPFRVFRQRQCEQFRVEETFVTKLKQFDKLFQGRGAMSIQVGESEEIVVPHRLDQEFTGLGFKGYIFEQLSAQLIEQTVWRTDHQQSAVLENATAFAKQRFGILYLLEAVPNKNGIEGFCGKLALGDIADVNSKALRLREPAGVFPDINAFRVPTPFVRGFEKSAVMTANLEDASARR